MQRKWEFQVGFRLAQASKQAPTIEGVNTIIKAKPKFGCVIEGNNRLPYLTAAAPKVQAALSFNK